MKKIAVLASGNGSNAEKIIAHFKNSEKAQISLIGSNRKCAYVLDRAKNHAIPFLWFSKADLEEGRLNERLIQMDIDLIVLAGFLLKIPDHLIDSFPDRIINIHPALLPKYGGKGMYGIYVHQAVKAKGEKRTGITIHYVNNNYDEGKVIFQKSIEILPEDSPEDIADKVHALEHKYFPKVIESLL
ncbi:MAG: phosphoribosylglycinamide formyltransferase [Anditalea sp.]